MPQRGKYVRTDEHRELKRAEGRRRAARVSFYQGIAEGLPNDELLARAVEAQRLDIPAQRYRWRGWIESLQSGRRVKIVSLPAEVYCGEALAALDAARALLQDDTAFADAVAQLNED